MKKKDICECCSQEFEYDPRDVRYGEFGFAYITCPICGQKTASNSECLRLNTKNLRFPEHFHHTSVATGALDLDHEDIEGYIRAGVTYLEQHPDEIYFAYTLGSVCVTIIRRSIQDEYHIQVSKDFYETFINCEDEEYAYED